MQLGSIANVLAPSTLKHYRSHSVLQDTSTGQTAAAHRTRLGPCSVMQQNPWNAVLCLGHANGTATMWAPNMSTPLVRLLCHRVSFRV